MKKIIAGDKVKVISGSDKGKIGVVQKCYSYRDKYYLIISGVNIKKYVKRSSSGSSFQTKEFPIDASNAMLVADEKELYSRVGFKFVDDIKRRYLKKTDTLV